MMTEEQQTAEYNKFLGHYAEVHEFIDSLATEYNSIVAMGGEFTFTDEMLLDVKEAITVLEDFRTKLHKVFLVNAIQRAGEDRDKWVEELAKSIPMTQDISKLAQDIEIIPQLGELE